MAPESPSLPSTLPSPQHFTPPDARRAHVNSPPPASSTASVMPMTSTGTALLPPSSTPLPSWPFEFDPQQRTVRSGRMKQVCEPPVPSWCPGPASPKYTYASFVASLDPVSTSRNASTRMRASTDPSGEPAAVSSEDDPHARARAAAVKEIESPRARRTRPCILSLCHSASAASRSPLPASSIVPAAQMKLPMPTRDDSKSVPVAHASYLDDRSQIAALYSERQTFRSACRSQESSWLMDAV